MSEHSTPALTVRPAAPGDASQILALADELGGSGPTERLSDQLLETRRRADAELFVADLGGLVVGFVYLHVIPTLIRDGCWARIASLAVHSDHRRSGVGRVLVAAAERFALDAGATSVELTSARDRTEAHAFYRASGYGETVNSLWFAKALPASEA